MDKYFSSMDQGGISALKTHLRNSQAKWDESAFGGAMYGADDAPGTSHLLPTTLKNSKTDEHSHQLSILTMRQATKITPTAMLIAEPPHARLLERALPLCRHRLATPRCKVSTLHHTCHLVRCLGLGSNVSKHMY